MIKIIHECLSYSILNLFSFFQFLDGENSSSFKFLLPYRTIEEKKKKFGPFSRVKSFTLEHSSSLKAKKGRKIKEGLLRGRGLTWNFLKQGTKGITFVEISVDEIKDF